MLTVISLALSAVVLAAPPAAAPKQAAQPAKPAQAAGRSEEPLPRTLDSLLASAPADSLILPLRRFEVARAGSAPAAEAALALGHLHYARSEYTQAAAAFSRAAARLDPARKPEARYWAGLSWLGMREADQARSAFEEVAASPSPRRAEAQLGLAFAYELEGKNDRALEALSRLLRGDPGEAGPAALERTIALAERLHRNDLARTARARLARTYPRSIEAAMLAAPGAAGAGGSRTRIELLSGAYPSSTRAQEVMNAARRAGYPDAEIVVRGEGSARVYQVRLGSYGDAAEARAAGTRAGDRLGVSWSLSGGE